MLRNYPYLKKDLLTAVSAYTNENGSWYTSTVNSLMFWRADPGRGVLRAVVKDSPQFEDIQDFLKKHSQMDQRELLSFELFYDFLKKESRLHRYTTEYMTSSNAVAKFILRPWFERLDPARCAAILKECDTAFEYTTKTLSHHASSFKNGAVESVQHTALAVLTPVQSASNLANAVAHPLVTAAAVKNEVVRNPSKAAGALAISLFLTPGGVIGNVVVAAEVAGEATHLNKIKKTSL